MSLAKWLFWGYLEGWLETVHSNGWSLLEERAAQRRRECHTQADKAYLEGDDEEWILAEDAAPSRVVCDVWR